MKVHASPLPDGSLIHQASVDADFADSYVLPEPTPQASPLQSYLDLVAQTPRWMNVLMALRNNAVRLVGLKHVGHLGDVQQDKPAAAYQRGDPVGIFSLLCQDAQEVVLHLDDSHLHVQISLFKRPAQDSTPATLALSTVVHIHNRLGRAYMSVVGPVHQRIVPLMLAQIARRHTPSR